MAISLKPQHLNRYRQIAWLFIKYGRSDLVKESGLEGTLAAEQRVTPKEAAKAEQIGDHGETAALHYAREPMRAVARSSSCAA